MSLWGGNIATQVLNSMFMYLLYAWLNSWNSAVFLTNKVFNYDSNKLNITKWHFSYLLNCSLTYVIVKCFIVELLVDPVLLNFKNLLTAGILFPKCSAQNHLQLLCFITEKHMKYVCMLHGKTCLNDVWGLYESHSYLFSKQCAADRTQQESMRTPPHRWKCFLRRAW